MFSNPQRFKLVWNAVPTKFKIPNPPRPDKSKRKSPRKRVLVQPDIYHKVQRTLSYIAEEKQRRASLWRAKRARLVRARNSKEMRTLKKVIKAKNDALRYLQRKQRAQTLKGAKFQMEEVLHVVKPLLTRDEMTLLKERLERKDTKQAYSNEFKHLAIRISFKSSSTYRYLSKRLHLPPKSTISRWTSDIRFEEGFDEDLFKVLEEKVTKLPEKDRVASLLMDEMSLKIWLEYDQRKDQIVGVKRQKNGNYFYPSSALTVMVRGLRTKWKQIISYHFAENAVSGDKVLNILRKTLDKMKKCGLSVVNFTSDQGSNFCSLVGQLSVDEEKPFFFHGKEKIFVTPDPPHLLKSSRNALLDHNIIIPSGKASWTHIRALFEHDRLQVSRLVPKLTLQHVEPPPIYGKMSVNRAAQVLSNRVACALKTYVSVGALPEDVLATAEYCEYLDKIFDVLNSSRRNGVTPFKSALFPDSEIRQTFISEAIMWLKSLKIVDKDNNVINNRFRFINGLILALSSVQQLTLYLCKEFNFEFLLTRRLCQDPLENLFGVIRGKNGFNANPSPLIFARSCKIILCS